MKKRIVCKKKTRRNERIAHPSLSTVCIRVIFVSSKWFYNWKQKKTIIIICNSNGYDEEITINYFETRLRIHVFFIYTRAHTYRIKRIVFPQPDSYTTNWLRKACFYSITRYSPPRSFNRMDSTICFASFRKFSRSYVINTFGNSHLDWSGAP